NAPKVTDRQPETTFLRPAPSRRKGRPFAFAFHCPSRASQNLKTFRTHLEAPSAANMPASRKPLLLGPADFFSWLLAAKQVGRTVLKLKSNIACRELV